MRHSLSPGRGHRHTRVSENEGHIADFFQLSVRIGSPPRPVFLAHTTWFDWGVNLKLVKFPAHFRILIPPPPSLLFHATHEAMQSTDGLNLPEDISFTDLFGQVLGSGLTTVFQGDDQVDGWSASASDRSSSTATMPLWHGPMLLGELPLLRKLSLKVDDASDADAFFETLRSRAEGTTTVHVLALLELHARAHSPLTEWIDLSMPLMEKLGQELLVARHNDRDAMQSALEVVRCVACIRPATGTLSAHPFVAALFGAGEMPLADSHFVTGLLELARLISATDARRFPEILYTRMVALYRHVTNAKRMDLAARSACVVPATAVLMRLRREPHALEERVIHRADISLGHFPFVWLTLTGADIAWLIPSLLRQATVGGVLPPSIRGLLTLSADRQGGLPPLIRGEVFPYIEVILARTMPHAADDALATRFLFKSSDLDTDLAWARLQFQTRCPDNVMEDSDLVSKIADRFFAFQATLSPDTAICFVDLSNKMHAALQSIKATTIAQPAQLTKRSARQPARKKKTALASDEMATMQPRLVLPPLPVFTGTPQPGSLVNPAATPAPPTKRRRIHRSYAPKGACQAGELVKRASESATSPDAAHADPEGPLSLPAEMDLFPVFSYPPAPLAHRDTDEVLDRLQRLVDGVCNLAATLVNSPPQDNLALAVTVVMSTPASLDAHTRDRFYMHANETGQSHPRPEIQFIAKWVAANDTYALCSVISDALRRAPRNSEPLFFYVAALALALLANTPVGCQLIIDRRLFAAIDVARRHCHALGPAPFDACVAETVRSAAAGPWAADGVYHDQAGMSIFTAWCAIYTIDRDIVAIWKGAGMLRVNEIGLADQQLLRTRTKAKTGATCTLCGQACIGRTPRALCDHTFHRQCLRTWIFHSSSCVSCGMGFSQSDSSDAE